MGIINKVTNLFKKKDETAREKEIFVIYTTKREIDLEDFFSRNKINFNMEDSVAELKRQYTVSMGEYTITINHLDRSIPKIYEQINGFPNYILHLAQPDKMDSRLFNLFTKISGINHVISIITEPDDRDKKGFDMTAKLLEELKGILFYQGLVFDHSRNMYMGPNGKHDLVSRLYDYDSAKKRKYISIEKLAALGFKTTEDLPAVVSEEELNLRSASETAKRAIILAFLTSKVEGLPENELKQIFDRHHLTAHLSPGELNFLNEVKPERQDIIDVMWRFEASKVLLWSLGYIKSLDFPDKACQGEEILKLINHEGPDKIISNAKLRDSGEILDALDLTYRLHWWTTEQRIKENGPKVNGSKNVNEGIVFERHYALNWLTFHGNAEWDEVSTET